MNSRSRFEACPNPLCQLDLLTADRQRCRRKWRVPKLVKLCHRHAPMRHGAPWVLFCHCPKRLFCRRVSKRVKQRDTAVELLLDRRHYRRLGTKLLPVSLVRRYDYALPVR